MQKIFRFKYEPCNGKCYAWCKVLPQELRKLDSLERSWLVKTMVDAHAKLCDNKDYSFGVDIDENNRSLFVAHFHSPDETTLFSGYTFDSVVNKVCARLWQPIFLQLMVNACTETTALKTWE